MACHTFHTAHHIHHALTTVVGMFAGVFLIYKTEKAWPCTFEMMSAAAFVPEEFPADIISLVPASI